MRSVIRLVFVLVFVIAACIIAFTVGQRRGRSESRTELIQNYTFVRDIAELASLEVSGSSTYKSTNIPEGETGMLASLKKYLVEQSVEITVPFTAKYGVDLSQDSIRIRKTSDSTVRIDLPQPKLLSFELRLDRQEARRYKGILLPQNDQFYTSFQKKLYTQGRQQLETNGLYLTRAQDRVCGLLRRYFAGGGLRSECHFAGTGKAVLN